ncbi:serine/threonine-protein kinase [Falsiroseomonas selenitidurans]|uniref:Serine/threonine protein kinase n=1 Tax=Falsiroseomonas selenitidurans TaxID=2716335 RepID=A0ABX1ECB8_9PROT|nr:serine/threonine-protein kinase [Falsiroseomonas selenitidurans]NKC34513.1 serine/threonine protein kinase [Falsiroseomonas selenitidurans]
MLPSEIAGKYEARGTLGAGAMGKVIDAFDRMIERRVAVKLVRLPAGDDAEAREAHARFRREAQAAGRLSHPNIVGVFDYGENADTAWIVMELVEGGTLKGVMDRGERMAVPQVVRVMEQILGALAYSHGRGVVHRDIKPANIMLTGEGPGGSQVKIADFGIARIESSTMTQVGTVMGTPSYMAPEQLRGEPVDARADIWAAGVVLYQLLTGEKPFDGGYSALMHRVQTTEPPPPSQLAVTAPRGLDAVVARALAKRPEDRFPSAAAFAEAIRAVVGPEATGGFGMAAFGGFAGAGKLPGLDDATMLATGQHRPAPPPPVAPAAAAPPKTSGGAARWALLAGVALLAAGGGAYVLTKGGAPDPAPPTSPAAPQPAPPPIPAPAPAPLPAPAPAPPPSPARA